MKFDVGTYVSTVSDGHLELFLFSSSYSRRSPTSPTMDNNPPLLDRPDSAVVESVVLFRSIRVPGTHFNPFLGTFPHL